MLKKSFRRLWRRFKGSVHLVKSDRGNDPISISWNRKQSCSGSQARSSLRSLNKTTLLADDEKEHHFLPSTSFSPSKLEEEGSLDHLEDKVVHMESISADRNYSIHGKGSDSINSERIENIVKTSRKNQPSAHKEYTHVDIEAIIAPILERRNCKGSQRKHNTERILALMYAISETATGGSAAMSCDSCESDSLTASSDGSDLDNEGSGLDDDMSDEESESAEDPDDEEFDIEHYIDKLIKRQNHESESDSDSDGIVSAISQNSLKQADPILTEMIEKSGNSDLCSTETANPDDEEDMSAAPSKESFADMETKKDTDPELPKLMKPSEMVKYLQKESELQSLAPETTEIEGAPKKVDVSLKENEKVDEVSPASTLAGSKAEDLRWPFSNFYVKEVKQDIEIRPEDQGMPLSDNGESLCSYKSIVVSASHSSRKRKVMLGRVWCQEWWAKGDSQGIEYLEKSYVFQ